MILTYSYTLVFIWKCMVPGRTLRWSAC